MSRRTPTASSNTQPTPSTPSRFSASTAAQTFRHCIIPDCQGAPLPGLKYCPVHMERANGQTLAEKVTEQRAAVFAAPNCQLPGCGLAVNDPIHNKRMTHGFHYGFHYFVPPNPAQAQESAEQFPEVTSVVFSTPEDAQKAKELCEALQRKHIAALKAQESKTWTPPVTCGQCEATADSVLELAKHWKTSGHTTARVQTNSGPRRRKEDQPGSAGTYFTKADECVRLCEALAAFWGDSCDAPIWPGTYLTEEDTPIRDLIRAAVGLNPLGWKAGAADPLTAADNRMAAEDDRKTPPAMGEDDMERDRR